MAIPRLAKGQHGTSNFQDQSVPSTGPSLGLITKTLAQSPVIRWILPARIRHKDKDDLIFVGEDFIEIKQIGQGGHLTHIATKADFDCRIMSAKVLGNPVFDDDNNDNLAFHVKVEDSGLRNGPFPETAEVPPQCLVLVLETQQLVFLFACENSQGIVDFGMMSNVPLPAFPDLPQQLGRHLAVDPRSRTIAVAAAMDNVVLYSVEPMEAGAQWGLGLLPISHERPLGRVRGAIQAMEFLYPPESDPEQVILLLVVIKDGKTSLVRIDWVSSAGIISAHYHNPLPILRGTPFPNLLIPIQSSAAFILTIGTEVHVFTDILGGQTKGMPIELPDCRPSYPGSSPLPPLWVAWTRPRRPEGPGKKEDFLYLAREDGDVIYLALNRRHPKEGGQATRVNNFGCHIESAFACYGTRYQNDFFAICGDMSEGAVYSIVPLPVHPYKSDSDFVSKLPNWTPLFDCVALKLPRHSDGSVRSRDALFVPGGRQPYGRLSELRFGFQARSGATFKIPHSVVQLWHLPIEERQELLMLLTSPTDSTVWRVSPRALETGLEDDECYIAEVEEDIGLSLTSRTLVSAMVAYDCIMQITENSISISKSGQHGLLRKECPPDTRITAAAIDEEHDVAVTTERYNGKSLIRLFHVTVNEDEANLQDIGTPVALDQDLVSAVISKSAFGMFAVFGTSNASLLFYGLDARQGLIPILEHKITGQEDIYNACEDVIVLSDSRQRDNSPSCHLMLLCGLRDGSLHAFELLASQEELFSVQSSQQFTLGFTSVKLRPDTATISRNSRVLLGLAAYATCGNGFFKITWSGAGSKELSISDVWITDAKDPSLQQSAITSFSVVPSSKCIGPYLPQSLIITSGDTGFITKVEDQPRVVPRSIQTPGTPTRAMYSKSFGCFIIVSVETSANPSQTHRGSESRSIKSMVRFKGNEASGTRDWEFVHNLEPGWRVYSITKWAYKDPHGKRYAFIVLGSGFDSNVSERGEITLLQPVQHDGVIEQVRPIRLKHFDTAVYSLAPYGETGLVACTNPWIYMFEYRPGESKFTEVCKIKTTHPGVHVTTAPPLVYVSTSEDSLLTFRYSAVESKFTLVGGDIARKTVFHLTLDIPYPVASPASIDGDSSTSVTLNLLSTRDHGLVGQLAPSPSARSFINAVTTLFEGKASRSQVRLRQANIRPPWKAATVPGVLEDRIVGTAVDGTVTGLAILESGLAHRLRWVQRLCERNSRLCPMALQHPMSRFIGDTEDNDDGSLSSLILPPLGFDAASSDSTEQQQQQYRRGLLVDPKDMYISGDVLQRLLNMGGSSFLVEMLEEEAGRKDRLGDWIRENLDSQLAMAGPLADEVKAVLDRWW